MRQQPLLYRVGRAPPTSASHAAISISTTNFSIAATPFTAASIHLAATAVTNPAASCIAVWFFFCKKRRLSPTRNALAAFAVLNGRPLIQAAFFSGFAMRSFLIEPTERSEKSGFARRRQQSVLEWHVSHHTRRFK